MGGMGILVGALGAYELGQVLSREALLLGVVVLLLLSEELQPVTREKELLAVLVLIDRFRAHCLENEDPFDILTEDPPGATRRKGAKQRSRGRFPAQKWRISYKVSGSAGRDRSFPGRIHPQPAPRGWIRQRSSVGADPQRLQDRAGKKWDETSRLVLLKAKTRLPVQFGRTMVIASACVLLIASPWEWMPIILSRLSGTGLGEVVLGLGFLVYLIQTQKWARRIPGYPDSTPCPGVLWEHAQMVTRLEINGATILDMERTTTW